MSDMYNDYNQDDRYYRDMENYSHYSDEPPENPQKTKSTVFTVIIILLMLAAAITVFAFIAKRMLDERSYFDENRDKIAESVSETDLPEKNNNSENDKSGNHTSTPGLFDIAAREDAKYLPDIVDEIMPSVVGISSLFEVEYRVSSFNPFWGFQTEPQIRQGVGTGTGIVMTEDGYIVTNAHVIYMENTDEYKAGEAKEVSVLFNNEEEYEAKIVAFDVETDLAVLKIDATGFTPATFGNSDELRVGELVIAVGNPLGFELFGTVTSGIVSARDREISINDKHMTLIQTDTAINEGNSGGPLLNSCGQVVGINSAKMSFSYGSASVEGLGFAIPINKAKEIIDDLVNYKHVKGRPQIGISATNIDETYSAYLGLPMGIFVRTVAEESAAEEAGIKIGDVIIGINDEAVYTMDELNSIKNTFKAGDTIILKIFRDGEDIDVPLTLHEDSNEMQPEAENTTEAKDTIN